MSIAFISDFQNYIHDIIFNSDEIMASIKKIYFGAFQETETPSILISIEKIDNKSIANVTIYLIQFQIIIFAKDSDHQNLFELSDKIVKVLEGEKQFFEGYQIAGMKPLEINLSKAQDLVLNRLSIKYHATVKSEETR